MDKLEKEIRNKKSELEDNPMLKIFFFFKQQQKVSSNTTGLRKHTHTPNQINPGLANI